jgi:PAS domain S-box-containing protein
MRGLKLKILLLTLVPIMLVLLSISGLAIYNKYQSENQLLTDHLNSYRTLLESGDLSFDTTQDKQKSSDLLNQQVILAEILHSDYSVVYSSENSAAPLITQEEQSEVDAAFQGIQTTKTITKNNKPAFSIITPLVVNGVVVGALHQILSETDSSARVMQYAIFILSLMLAGLFICFVLIYLLLDGTVLKNIYKLKQATLEIQKGNLTKEIQVKTNDEIGELAASFNKMTKNLLRSRKSVEDKVKELSAEHGKLSSLVESVKLGVVMVDLSLNVVLANSAAKKILGKGPEENIVFHELSEKIKGSINISQALSYYVKSGKPLNVQEVVIEERYFRLFMSPVRDIIEKIFIGAVVVIEDITDEKMLDKMRTEIVSITSHQLRTPLTIIKGNLEMVLEGDVGPISDAQKDLLSDSYKGNERMIKLINDLMDAAKIDEGKFVVALESAQLEDVVKEIVSEISPLAVTKKVQLSYDYPPKPLSPVKINRLKVKQVLQNLIVNAIQYSSVGDKGKVNVEIKEDDGFLKFMVKDNGVGIPAAEQDKLFERFFRGSNVTKMDPGGGTGLGLYIAKAIVEQSGGKIWFESKEGEGTAFYATFPC